MAIGPVQLGRLAPGKSRPLGRDELTRLRRAAERPAHREMRPT